jgi:hypothetical protein
MMKKFIALLIAGIMLIAMAGCGKQASAGDASPAPRTSAAEEAKDSDASEPAAVSIGAEDMDSAWDEAAATTIALGEPVSISGGGASVQGGVVTIATGGTYVVTGTLSDGQIVVDATKKDVVRLVLNGARITNQRGAAIYAPQCDKLIITLADGTQNAVTDGGGAFVYADAAAEEPNAALFCKDDLTINGTGALTVNAGFNNGIGTKDDLLIVGGSFAVSAENHGIRGNDSVAILGGGFSITAGGDGIHSNGDITISGGDCAIASGDDGVHADQTVRISGGSVSVTESYEGVEGANVDISGGAVTVHASDDGINAAGGADASGGYGGDRFAPSGAYGVAISGGTVTVYSGSDGIDSNGTLDITGGTVAIFVNAPRDGDATDVNGGGAIPPALYVPSAIRAGAKIAVDELWSIVPVADATAFCLIIPGVASGQSYGITADGSAIATVTATEEIQGMMGGGHGGGMGGKRPGGKR